MLRRSHWSAPIASHVVSENGGGNSERPCAGAWDHVLDRTLCNQGLGEGRIKVEKAQRSYRHFTQGCTSVSREDSVHQGVGDRIKHRRVLGEIWSSYGARLRAKE